MQQGKDDELTCSSYCTIQRSTTYALTFQKWLKYGQEAENLMLNAASGNKKPKESADEAVKMLLNLLAKNTITNFQELIEIQLFIGRE